MQSARFQEAQLPFEFIESMGAGGMSHVHRVRHRATGVTAVAKFLSPHLAKDPIIAERFEREIRVLRVMEHPRIVRHLDDGWYGDERFYVMEMLSGGTLADRLRTKVPFSLDEVLHYAQQISEALDYLHRHGIIHRDLKPANLFLTETPEGEQDSLKISTGGNQIDLTPDDVDPQEGVTIFWSEPSPAKGRPASTTPSVSAFESTKLLGNTQADSLHRVGPAKNPSPKSLNSFPDVKLGDFGISFYQGVTRLTDSGRSAGTCSYMAPEAITGDQTLSARSDLYALGCCLFEFVTGRTPYKAKTQFEMLKQHVEVKPPRPTSLNPECPKDLEELILLLLQKRPSNRPANAHAVREFLKDVRRSLERGQRLRTWTSSPARPFAFSPDFTDSTNATLSPRQPETPTRLMTATTQRTSVAPQRTSSPGPSQ